MLLLVENLDITKKKETNNFFNEKKNSWSDCYRKIERLNMTILTRVILN